MLEKRGIDEESTRLNCTTLSFMVSACARVALLPPPNRHCPSPFCRQVRTLLHQYARDGNVPLLKDNIHGVSARVHGDPFLLLPPLPIDETDELGNTPLMSAPQPHVCLAPARS